MAPNEKTTKEPAADERLRQADREDDPRHGADYGGVERSTMEREQDEQMTDPERRREIRRRWQESALPDLPLRAGYHRCWVSTSHPVDTPQRRQRFGYQFVKYDDVRNAGWSADTTAIKDGQFLGAVMWRELIAMECTQKEYREYMREFHFDQPNEQALGVLTDLDSMNEEVRAKGGRITLEEGMEEMRQRMRRPPPAQFEG